VYADSDSQIFASLNSSLLGASGVTFLKSTPTSTSESSFISRALYSQYSPSNL
jgi:hypothetical protein